MPLRGVEGNLVLPAPKRKAIAPDRRHRKFENRPVKETASERKSPLELGTVYVACITPRAGRWRGE